MSNDMTTPPAAPSEVDEPIIFLVEGAESFKKGMPRVPRDQPGFDAKAAGFRAFTRYPARPVTDR
jgi:type III restriction enzyme